MNETTLTLRTLLAEHVRDGELVEQMDNDWVRCLACGHRCRIPPGHDGICKVRYNDHGVLKVPTGYAAGLALDPIEKKPFFHVLPGSRALSFGMLGCDYHCSYCQNWLTSQTLRNPAAVVAPEPIRAEGIVELAVRRGAPVITSTYNEPLITSEWAVEVFRLAKAVGIKCSYVSNGNGTPEVIAYIRPYIDCYKIDLKSFRQKNYQQLGGKLQTVLDTIRLLHREGVWVEIVTLVVPGFNDSDGELRDIAGFLASVSADIPWHVTAFHPDYQMQDVDRTPARTLLRATEIGRESGLRFVYAGNLPGMTGDNENTYCPACHELLILREGFHVRRNGIHQGKCPRCSQVIPGIWH
ncbi:MAG TPA: AmmeMemoRadiSam system radical SAM enzyme [Bacteroidota bacterium]|nr:AmmeMemoRadiSam system radical SAM enzyme [Bacteroidota bacterium]